MMEIGYRPYAEIARMIGAGEVNDVVGAAVLANVAQVVDRTDCIMVSPGVTRDKTERLGFRFAATTQEALDMAFERQGREAEVAVLRHGGRILPLTGDKVTDAAQS